MLSQLGLGHSDYIVLRRLPALPCRRLFAASIPAHPSSPAQFLVPSAHPHRASLEVIVEGLVQQVLLAAARRANEAEVDVVVGAREPLAAGGHSDRVGGHDAGQLVLLAWVQEPAKLSVAARAPVS